MGGAIVMAVVALVLLIGGVGLFFAPAGADAPTHPDRQEAANYRKRIAGTMLVAAAVILFAFAYALWSWNRGG